MDSAAVSYDSDSPFLAKSAVPTAIAAEGFLTAAREILIVVTFAFKDDASSKLAEQFSQSHYSFQDHRDHQHLVMLAAITKAAARIAIKPASIVVVMRSLNVSFDCEDEKNCLVVRC